MMVLEVILKEILKVYFRLIISSPIRSLERKACNKTKISVETLFVLYVKDTEHLVRFPFCHLCIAGGFKKREK